MRILTIAGCLMLMGLPFSRGTAEEGAALPDALSAGWKGEKVCELLHEDENIRALRCTFPPGVGHEPHYHLPHFGYVLSGGTMRVSDQAGTREIAAPAGGTWESTETTRHQALNVGETTTQYLIIEKKY